MTPDHQNRKKAYAVSLLHYVAALHLYLASVTRDVADVQVTARDRQISRGTDRLTTVGS